MDYDASAGMVEGSRRTQKTLGIQSRCQGFGHGLPKPRRGGPIQHAGTTQKPNYKPINKGFKRFLWFIIQGMEMGVNSGEQVDLWQALAEVPDGGWNSQQRDGATLKARSRLLDAHSPGSSGGIP